MNRPYRALATMACVAALTAAGVAPAAGARWVHQDAVGDAQTATMTYDDQVGSEPNWTTDADETATDVTRLVVRHGVHRVILRTSLRDISAASGGISYDIRTGGRAFWAEQRLGNDPSATAFVLRRGNGDRVRCTGLERSVNRTTDQAMVNIPRRCLGKPKWVRVGAGVSRFVETSPTSDQIWADDSQRDGQVQGYLKLSPRVHRG